jgi:hypothetical protein
MTGTSGFDPGPTIGSNSFLAVLSQRMAKWASVSTMARARPKGVLGHQARRFPERLYCSPTPPDDGVQPVKPFMLYVGVHVHALRQFLGRNLILREELPHRLVGVDQNNASTNALQDPVFLRTSIQRAARPDMP